MSDENVGITLAIFANHPRHPIITFWITRRLYIELPLLFGLFSNAMTRWHVHEFFKLFIHTSVAIIADHKSYYGQFVYIGNWTLRYKPIGAGSPGSAILARVIRNTRAGKVHDVSCLVLYALIVHWWWAIYSYKYIPDWPIITEVTWSPFTNVGPTFNTNRNM